MSLGLVSMLAGSGFGAQALAGRPLAASAGFAAGGRLHGRNAGNVTSDGHSQLPASGGDTVLKCTDVSLTLVLAGNLANCPEAAFRKLKERCPGAEACVIREASNVRPLVLLQALRCGGVAGAESETLVPCRTTSAYKVADI